MLLNPDGNVRFADPIDCVLTVLDVHGAGLDEPQFPIVTVKVVVVAAFAVVGEIAAE